MSAILCNVDAITYLITTNNYGLYFRWLYVYLLRARAFALRNQVSTLEPLQETCRAALDMTRRYISAIL
jgi:hypothetical protein